MRGFLTRLLEKVICSSKKLVTLYGKYYNKIVEREVCLADLDESHKVLCVGGIRPWTAMLFAFLTGAEIDVVDIDHQAVYNGQKVVKMFGLQDKVG